MRAYLKSIIISVFVFLTYLLCYIGADTIIPTVILDIYLSSSQKQVLFFLGVSAIYFFIPVVAEFFKGFGTTRKMYQEIESEIKEKDFASITERWQEVFAI